MHWCACSNVFSSGPIKDAIACLIGSVRNLNPVVAIVVQIIRALTINHIQMQRILAAQDKSNRITQFWFMVLAVGGLIASVVAIFF
jgi:hypothetical protein